MSRGPHVRPLHEQVGRDPRRNGVGRGSGRQRFGQQFGQIVPVAAQEDGETPLRVRQPVFELGLDGLGVPQVLAYAVEERGVGEAAVVAGGGDVFALHEDIDHPSADRDSPPKVDDLEVGADRFREDPDPRGLVVGLRGEVLGAGGERGAAGASPEVHLVGEVRTQGPGRDREPLRQREAGGKLFQPEFLNLGAEARVRGVRQVVDPCTGRDDRPDRGPGDPRSFPGLTHPGDGCGHVQIRIEHGVDDPVERRIGKRLPPLQRLMGADGCGSLLEVRRHFRRRIGKFGRRRQGAAEVQKCSGN